MSSSTHAITIPTKQHDGGNDTALRAFSPKSKVDAFAKYSSNFIRMKTLLLLEVEDNEDDGGDDDSLDYLGPLNDALRHIRVSDHVVRSNTGPGDASKRRKGNNSHPITITEQDSGSSGDLGRKTRISFELHPDLLLHDLFDLHLHASDLIPDDDDDEDESKE